MQTNLVDSLAPIQSAATYLSSNPAAGRNIFEPPNQEPSSLIAAASPVDSELQNPVGKKGLPGWAYLSRSLAVQEHERLIRPSWQYVCHVEQVKNPGAYATLELGPDPVLVLRGQDGVLRAFVNACRHRGFKIMEGAGECHGRVTCRYHGWSYFLDGGLAKVPSPETFPGIHRDQLGLRPLELEVLFGLVFVKVAPGGPSLAIQFEDWMPLLSEWQPEQYVPSGKISEEIWACNWKVAVDNNLENYHVPIGHPGYHRMLDSEETGRVNPYGVSASFSTVRERLSGVWSERAYQRLALAAVEKGYLSQLRPGVRKQWCFLTCQPNIGLNLYPEGMDLFQVLPATEGTCRVRAATFIRANPSREVQAMHYLNLRVNTQVSREDQYLCERVQQSMGARGWEPGPLSSIETCLADFHARLRRVCPDLNVPESPANVPTLV